MATSIRQSIIDSIITRLQTITIANQYETDLGNNVFEWRETDIELLDLPCVVLRDPSESVVARGGNHHYSLEIELEAKSLASDTALVRNIIADITKAIGVDPNFDSLVYQTTPVENETLEIEHKGKLFSSITMKFEVNYSTQAFKPYG